MEERALSGETQVDETQVSGTQMKETQMGEPQMDETQTMESRDVCMTGIVGGTMAFLAPLAVFSYYCWIVPLVALCLCLFAIVRMALHRTPMIGRRLAVWGLLCSTLFGTAGVVNELVFHQCQIQTARKFADQWMALMLEGREMEAIELRRTPLTRVKEAGLVQRYKEAEKTSEEFKNFQKEVPVQLLRREFRNGQAKFVQAISRFQQHNSTQFLLIYEVSTGEGTLRKSRDFCVNVACLFVEEGNRYDWAWRSVSLPVPRKPVQSED